MVWSGNVHLCIESIERFLGLLDQVSVGKMWFDREKQRGVLDKSFVPLNVPLRKDSD